jgi:hypothetical protein
VLNLGREGQGATQGVLGGKRLGPPGLCAYMCGTPAPHTMYLSSRLALGDDELTKRGCNLE